MHAMEMIRTHREVKGETNDALVHALEQCFDCAQTCTACADACAAEPMAADLAQCIRLCLDCADVCAATGRVATRRTGSNDAVTLTMLIACETACRRCAEECERHAGHHAHCRICGEACRRCEAACREAADAMGAND